MRLGTAATSPLLLLLGGALGGALSSAAFWAVRPAEAAPRGGSSSPKAPDPTDRSAPPTVMIVPPGGIVFRTGDGKTLARLYAHDQGALFSVFNNLGRPVATLGADEETSGGRLALHSAEGNLSVLALGRGKGGLVGVLDAQGQGLSARLEVTQVGPGSVGALTLWDVRRVGFGFLPNDIERLKSGR